MKLTSNDIFKMSRDGVWGLPKGVYEVTYSDGVTLRNHNQAIIFDWYCWRLFELYPDTGIPSTCSVLSTIGDKNFTQGTTIKCLETIFNYICFTNRVHYYKDKEPLLKLVYVTSNMIFNEIVHNVSNYVNTIDAVDFLELMDNEEVTTIFSEMQPFPDSIDRTYKKVRKFMNDNKYHKNKFIQAYTSKSVNENQANQCIGPRGFVTDLDRTVFKQPILNGFIRGMGNLYEVLTESRTAAKSLNASENNIRTSEYASRRMQLVAMSVLGVENQDCGSTNYLELVVTEKYLPNLKGVWYKINRDDKLKYITGDEKELIGETILMRSAFGCLTKDRSKICTKCLGRISENFKENSNIGYLMTAYLMAGVTQNILSTKHLTKSVSKMEIELEGNSLKYFRVTEDNLLSFRKELDLSNHSLILSSTRLTKLIDALSLNHSNIQLNRIGELDSVTIRNNTKLTPVQDTINVSFKGRESSITKELLKYIRKTGYTVDGRGYFIIPLDNWNKDDPIFENQMKEKNIVAFVNKLSSLIEVTAKSKDTLEEHFFKVCDLVFDNFDCNISALQTIVYGTTSYNEGDNNFRLSRFSPIAKPSNRTLLFRNRSMSQLFVYQSQTEEILGYPEIIFNNIYRSNHPLDVLFTPQDIIQ